MKNIKHHTILITLSCFIGQLLVGCNVGGTSSTSSNKLTPQYQAEILKKYNLSPNDLEPFEKANNETRLAGNEIQMDVFREDSRTNFQIINNSGLPIRLVGCINPDKDHIDIKLREDITFGSKTMQSSNALKVAGYPDTMLDPNDFKTDNYIRFNKPDLGSRGKITCYYNVSIQGAGDISFKLEGEYYPFWSSADVGQYLDYPIKANEDYKKLTWVRTLGKWVGTIALFTGATYLIRSWYMNKKKTQLKAEMLKILNISFNNIMRSIEYAEDETKLEEIAKNFTPFKNAEITKDDLASLKQTLIEKQSIGKYNRSYIDKEGYMTLEYKTFSGQITKKYINEIEFGNFNKITDEGARVLSLENIIKDIQVQTTDPKYFEEFMSSLSSKGGNIAKANAQRSTAIGLDTIKTSGWVNIAATGLEVCSVVGSLIVANYLVKLLSKDSQGTEVTSLVKYEFKPIKPSEAKQFNQEHSPEDWIHANANMTTLEHAANNHLYVISPQNNSGMNTQEVITLRASTLTEPIYRPNKVDRKDPYLGEINMDNEYDAVIALTFDSNINAISEDTNMMEDAYDEVLSQGGYAGLRAKALPNPDYQLTKITDTKTAKTLYSQGSSSNSNSLIKATGWNNIQVGAIKGLAINTDQVADMQVKISKEAAQAKLGSEGDMIGNGFVAKFIEESSNGAETINSVRSDSYEALLKKRYAESPELSSPYLYNVYTCDYPTKVGDACGLKMHLGGMDNDKHMGKIYLADGASRTTAIPVYLNYHLLGSYFELNVSDKTSPYKIDIMNTHNEAYTKMTLEYKSVDDDSYLPVPMDMLAKDTTCNLDSGLQPQTQCSIYFDFSKIDSDSYQFRINGIKSTAKLGAPDQFDVKVRVN